MMYVDTVSCNYGNVPEVHGLTVNDRILGELLLAAFMLPRWTAEGIRYGSPCCTVIIAEVATIVYMPEYQM